MELTSSPDQHHQLCILRGTWQLASVFHFLNVFRPIIDLNLKFSMEELESALLVPNTLLGDIHICLLKAIPPSSRNPVNHETWIAVLSKKLKDWWHAVAEGPFPLVPQRGDEIMKYKQLSADVRVIILKALCEARLDQEDMRAFVSDMTKQETSFLSIRKERTGTDLHGAVYWYERDPIAGHRLYRELQRSSGKDMVKLRGHLVSAPAMGHWETLATNLDEFQQVADRLCSSKNKMEVLIGNKINSDIVPDLINAEKRKQRALKKQLRQSSLLVSDLNAESLACSRPRRERKPVSYTFDEYDNSINEAIDMIKGLHASRVVEGSSASQDREEEIDGQKACESTVQTSDTFKHFSESDMCSIKHDDRELNLESGRTIKIDLSSVPQCSTDTSSECNNEEQEACVNGHLHKRRRAGSLDSSDLESNHTEDMDAAGMGDFKEEMDSKSAIPSRMGNLHVMKPQEGSKRSLRSTRV